tara:strand:- start:4867 stop:5535 length:669 start_codon:yes stop_codon:yes gene_type:complete
MTIKNRSLFLSIFLLVLIQFLFLYLFHEKKMENWIKVVTNNSDLPIDLKSEVFRALFILIKEDSNLNVSKELCTNRKMIQNLFQLQRIPKSLSAIPYVETKYRNLSGKENAGIWNFDIYTSQMYGLAVDNRIDERLDLKKSSEVAVKYLNTLYELFKNWNLVILAYRYGEGQILQLVRNYPNLDAWEIESKIGMEDSYLGRVLAAIIFLENIECERVKARPH